MAAAAVVTYALAGCTNTDAADQQVIDRLSKLDVMSLPPGAVELSRTDSKGGGNSVIRNASSVTLVYAMTQEPTDLRKDVHARFDRSWNFIDSNGGPLGGWVAGGALQVDPGTIANVEVRRVAPGDKVPPGSLAVVTVSVSATRPG